MHRSGFDRLIDTVGAVAGALFIGLVVLVCVDVAVRYGGIFSMPWSFDVAEFALYATTFLGAPWVLKERGHISVDIVVELFPARTRRRFERVSDCLGALVSLLLLYLFAQLVWRSYSQGILVHKTLIFPEWVLFSVAPLAFLLLVLVFVRSIWRRRDGRETAPRTDGL